MSGSTTDTERPGDAGVARTTVSRVAPRPAAVMRDRRLQVGWDPVVREYRITLG